MFEVSANHVVDLSHRHAPLIFVVFAQVSFVQFSDDAKTEFKLNTYHDKGIVLSALQSVRYRGGNTKTGTGKRLVVSIQDTSEYLTSALENINNLNKLIPDKA